jgi:hypothetical protein
MRLYKYSLGEHCHGGLIIILYNIYKQMILWHSFYIHLYIIVITMVPPARKPERKVYTKNRLGLPVDYGLENE